MGALYSAEIMRSSGSSFALRAKLNGWMISGNFLWNKPAQTRLSRKGSKKGDMLNVRVIDCHRCLIHEILKSFLGLWNVWFVGKVDELGVNLVSGCSWETLISWLHWCTADILRLVVGNMFYFPIYWEYIGNNHPNWLSWICFIGVETTNHHQPNIIFPFILVGSKVVVLTNPMLTSAHVVKTYSGGDKWYKQGKSRYIDNYR